MRLHASACTDEARHSFPARGYTHMPLQPGSTYEILHDAFDEAHRLANRDSPDPELDLQGLVGWRRLYGGTTQIGGVETQWHVSRWQ